MQLLLHVSLSAEPPVERIVLTGSHETFGRWNPRGGIQLEQCGNFWVTKDPVTLAPCERVEFKFVRLRNSGEVEWETGSNRILQVPPDGSDVHFQGSFNGDGFVRCKQHVANSESVLWKQRHDEAAQALEVLRKDFECRREAHEMKRRYHAELLQHLGQELLETQRQLKAVGELGDKTVVPLETMSQSSLRAGDIGTLGVHDKHEDLNLQIDGVRNALEKASLPSLASSSPECTQKALRGESSKEILLAGTGYTVVANDSVTHGKDDNSWSFHKKSSMDTSAGGVEPQKQTEANKEYAEKGGAVFGENSEDVLPMATSSRVGGNDRTHGKDDKTMALDSDPLVGTSACRAGEQKRNEASGEFAKKGEALFGEGSKEIHMAEVSSTVAANHLATHGKDVKAEPSHGATLIGESESSVETHEQIANDPATHGNTDHSFPSHSDPLIGTSASSAETQKQTTNDSGACSSKYGKLSSHCVPLIGTSASSAETQKRTANDQATHENDDNSVWSRSKLLIGTSATSAERQKQIAINRSKRLSSHCEPLMVTSASSVETQKRTATGSASNWNDNKSMSTSHRSPLTGILASSAESQKQTENHASKLSPRIGDLAPSRFVESDKRGRRSPPSTTSGNRSPKYEKGARTPGNSVRESRLNTPKDKRTGLLTTVGVGEGVAGVLASKEVMKANSIAKERCTHLGDASIDTLPKDV